MVELWYLTTVLPVVVKYHRSTTGMTLNRNMKFLEERINRALSW